MLFTHDIKKIEGATDKNGLKNATCRHTLKVYSHWMYMRLGLEGRKWMETIYF